MVVVALSAPARISGKCLTIPHLRLLFCFCCFQVEIGSRIPIPFFWQDQSTVAQWAQMIVAESSLINCVWTVSGEVPTLCLDSDIVSPLWLCEVKGVCIFRCNLPPALLAEWPGSFMLWCGKTGVERTMNKSQHTNFLLIFNFFPPRAYDSSTKDHEVSTFQQVQVQSGILVSMPQQLATTCSQYFLISYL